MADLANVNAPPDQRPAGAEPEQPPQSGGLRLVARPGSADAARLEKPPGNESRPSQENVVFTLTKWPFWGHRNDGSHGVVATHEPPDMVGGQNQWRTYSPRTFRNLPSQPWDAGTEVG